MRLFQNIIKLLAALASAYAVVSEILKGMSNMYRSTAAESDLSGAASCFPETDLLDQPQTRKSKHPLVDGATQGVLK